MLAGPNGSGKSTIVDSLRTMKVNGHLIPFGYYINADDTASLIKGGDFSFDTFDLVVQKENLVAFAVASVWTAIESTAIKLLLTIRPSPPTFYFEIPALKSHLFLSK